MILNSQAKEYGFTFASSASLDQLVRQYRWRRMCEIRLTRRITYFLRRSAWVTDVEGYRAMKRAMDIVGSLFLMMLTAPLLVVVALAIKLSDNGSVLFWQSRIGLHGKAFSCPKFRSMVPNADKVICSISGHNHHGNSITFKMKRDPRVTWVGRVIRRFSVDELPQLWCVLTGGMALVGPRPALPREVSKYRLAQRRRLDVKPGLTCLWQVRGRADLPFWRQLELDVEYIESQSLWLDLKLVLMTVPAVLIGRGAY
jgi:lipopolysaccharide/colanic/teichoic acid biosynthesis glycosyltransferase